MHDDNADEAGDRPPLTVMAEQAVGHRHKEQIPKMTPTKLETTPCTARAVKLLTAASRSKCLLLIVIVILQVQGSG